MTEVSEQSLDPAKGTDKALPVIAVDDLHKSYGRKRVKAVDGLSFRVEKGEIFGLLGPDGAGKTSVIQILAGVLSANRGAAQVAGINCLRAPERVKRLIGYMPQGLGLNLYDSLSVAENIEFFRQLRQVPASQFYENRDRLLDMTRLSPFLDRPAGKLSGGMRQKLALICTLVHLPDILLLDEPTTGVDPISRRDFWTIIHDLVAERAVTVLLTTSYMDEAERCHEVALMHAGREIASGEPEQLIAEMGAVNIALRCAEPERLLNLVRRWPEVENAALFGSEVRLMVTDPAFDLDAALHAADITDFTQRRNPAGLEEVFVHALRQPENGVGSGPDGTVPQSGLTDTDADENGLSLSKSARAGSDGEHAVVTEGLTCRFGDFTAVDAVSLSVRRGEIVGLLGPNGAGKTTLIKMLCGLLPPSEGRAEVAGYEVTRAAHPLRFEIGYMSQRFSLYRDLPVDSNLKLCAGLYGLAPAQRTARIDRLLSELELSAYRDRLTKSLPLGIRQRLALANALLHSPSILFLDEPTSGVDPIARRRFWNIVHLLARREGVTVIVSTHYMDEAEHCDRLGFMQQGRLIALDTPQALAQQAEQRAGPLVTVRSDDFARCFAELRPRFPTAMLHGRRIQWQSAKPEDDMAQARRLLAGIAPHADIASQPLSMEETFVSFLTFDRQSDV